MEICLLVDINLRFLSLLLNSHILRLPNRRTIHLVLQLLSLLPQPIRRRNNNKVMNLPREEVINSRNNNNQTIHPLLPAKDTRNNRNSNNHKVTRVLQRKAMEVLIVNILPNSNFNNLLKVPFLSTMVDLRQ